MNARRLEQFSLSPLTKAAKEIQPSAERLRSLAFATMPHERRASAFHTFCQNLLRRFSCEAGIVREADLLEETAEIEREPGRCWMEDARVGELS